MSRLYIHEFVDIVGPNRAAYMHHATARWSPIGRAERDQLCFGVWGVVGSTGRWPQVVNMWEYPSWEALGRNFEVELGSPTLQDPALAEWWAEAAAYRSGGTDRILVAADWSPGIEQLCAEGVRGVGYAHEIVRTPPGAAPDLLASVRDRGIAAHAADGWTLVGAFARAMAADDEVVLLWAFADWAAWASAEAGVAQRTSQVARWYGTLDGLVLGRERILLVDAELAPLRTGHQPG